MARNILWGKVGYAIMESKSDGFLKDLYVLIEEYLLTRSDRKWQEHYWTERNLSREELHSFMEWLEVRVSEGAR